MMTRDELIEWMGIDDGSGLPCRDLKVVVDCPTQPEAQAVADVIVSIMDGVPFDTWRSRGRFWRYLMPLHDTFDSTVVDAYGDDADQAFIMSYKDRIQFISPEEFFNRVGGVRVAMCEIDDLL